MGENAPKIVIVVLVIVAVVFFIGVGVGAGGQNNGQGGLSSISVDGVVNTFAGLIPAPAVTASEINASPSSCFDPNQMRFIVPNVGNCHFDITESSANIRALKLQISPGQQVHIESTSDPVEDKPLLSKINLPSGGNAQTTLNFFKKHSSITISNCVPNSGSICTLTIVQ